MKSFLTWFAIFFLAYWVMGKFFPHENKTNEANNTIMVAPIKNNLVLERIAQFKIQNNTTETITFNSPCGNPENLTISSLVNGKKYSSSEELFQSCDATKIAPSFKILPGASHILDIKPLNNILFSEAGKYVADIKLLVGSETRVIESGKFVYEEPGFLRTLFRKMISRPFFNLLAYFTSIMPFKSLGLSIIALTLLIRMLLFLPNQKAMRSQRKLQTLQPKIEALKQKYGKDQQTLAMKTMELYKAEKINPMSSCLPMVMQMPFLIGIYSIVKSGIAEYHSYLLYSFNQIDLAHINTQFLGLNLEVPNTVVLPILVAGAQFVAVKLSFAAAKKKTQKKKNAPEGMAVQMEQMQKMMLYIMPLMIGFFTATFPAGVGIYWLTSTVFGIFQQKLVNWQLDNEGTMVRRKH